MKIMNQENQNNIEDLTINQEQEAAVKGGPIFMQYDGIKGSVTAAGHEKWIELSGGPQSTESGLRGR
jgi:hypothetical protein